MAKKKKIEKIVEEVEEVVEPSNGETPQLQMPDGSIGVDEDKYAKAWLALGGGLCSIMGDNVKMHSFDPFVSVAWKEQMLIQLPPDFVEELLHKFTYLQWQVHNYEQQHAATQDKES